MKKLLLVISSCLLIAALPAQTVSSKLQTAFRQFESDPQLKYAISSLYVIDAKTGQVVFDRNSRVGVAPASTQKIITAATAFELLGADYRYLTRMGYQGIIYNDSLSGFIYFVTCGDPTFGSWRYASTTPAHIMTSFADSLRKAGIKKADDHFYRKYEFYFDAKTIPDGWIWQDIGNYYGAGASGLNWKENQYDLVLTAPDKAHQHVGIVYGNGETDTSRHFINQLSTGEKGSGDNAYIYLPGEGDDYLLQGTIPEGEKRFKISGAVLHAPDYFINDFRQYLKDKKVLDYPAARKYHLSEGEIDAGSIIATHWSPPLDSIVYWFLKKSINLYGEALLNTLGFFNSGLNFGSTATGIKAIQDFWKQKGIDEDELNISDGSGLSPQNRVTAHAQVEILQYARSRPWFSSFYTALPEYNNMKMKSGTIKDVKAFCGYHRAKDGKEYIFSFLVNNYNGAASALVKKMYAVLDILK